MSIMFRSGGIVCQRCSPARFPLGFRSPHQQQFMPSGHAKNSHKAEFEESKRKLPKATKTITQCTHRAAAICATLCITQTLPALKSANFLATWDRTFSRLVHFFSSFFPKSMNAAPLYSDAWILMNFSLWNASMEVWTVQCLPHLN